MWLQSAGEVLSIDAIEQADCRALQRAPTPGLCNTGVKIDGQRALQPAGTPGRTRERGNPTPDQYFDALRVDTLKLSAKVDMDTADPVGEHWIEKKRVAAHAEDLPTIQAHDGTELKVHPHGPNDNRAVLMTGEGIEVTAVPKSPVPFIAFEFGAEQCWNRSPAELVQWARDFAALWGIEITSTLVSRLDACVDVDERFYRSDVDRFEGRHRGNLTGTVAFSDGRKGFTGFRYDRSKDRDLTFRVYDKRAEADSGDGRSLWPEVWDAHQVDEDTPVWRVEFEARRGRLEARGIDSWDDLTRSKLEQFWTYCTEQFARMDRQVWDRIQNASTQDAAERAEVDPNYDPERLTKQAAGCVRRIADELDADVDAVMEAVRDEV